MKEESDRTALTQRQPSSSVPYVGAYAPAGQDTAAPSERQAPSEQSGGRDRSVVCGSAPARAEVASRMPAQ